MDEAVARLAEQPDAEKFSASRNLVIDIDPAFPWQITALDGYGANPSWYNIINGASGAAMRPSTPQRQPLTVWTCAARRCR